MLSFGVTLLGEGGGGSTNYNTIHKIGFIF